MPTFMTTKREIIERGKARKPLTKEEADALIQLYRAYGFYFEQEDTPKAVRLLRQAIRKLETIAYDSP